MSENTLRVINMLANLAAMLTLVILLVVTRIENRRLRDQVRGLVADLADVAGLTPGRSADRDNGGRP